LDHHGTKATKFAHRSEEEFARLLDYYGVRWEYEPHVFVLEWSEDGNPTESFTPDFYLPDFGYYIELTTRRKNLVARKRSKIERTQARYPSVMIKLFHPSDFAKLMMKYEATAPALVGAVPGLRRSAGADERLG
jgi:hypothetical protein